MRVDVETSSQLTAGQTVCDVWGRSGLPANVDVARRVHRGPSSSVPFAVPLCMPTSAGLPGRAAMAHRHERPNTFAVHDWRLESIWSQQVRSEAFVSGRCEQIDGLHQVETDGLHHTGDWLGELQRCILSRYCCSKPAVVGLMRATRGTMHPAPAYPQMSTQRCEAAAHDRCQEG